jgi:hypothetical protein
VPLLCTLPQTEEDKRRLTGAGLLVVDVAAPEVTDGAPLDPQGFYLVPDHSSGAGGVLTVLQGAAVAAGIAPVAAVLFLARPPLRESALTSTELLQL